MRDVEAGGWREVHLALVRDEFGQIKDYFSHQLWFPRLVRLVSVDIQHG